MDYRSEVKDVSFLKPQFAENNIPIIFSCDKDNISEVAVSVSSIIYNSSERYNYDIIILHNDLDIYDEDMFMEIEGRKKNINVRFQYIEHNFHEGYIQIDSMYPIVKLIEFFEPIIMKRYDRIISISPGTIIEDSLIGIISSESSPYGFQIYTGNEKTDVVCYDSKYFRMRYSIRDIVKAVTKEVLYSNIVFFQNLCGNNDNLYVEKKNNIISYVKEKKKVVFWNYAKSTPFYEKLIYTDKKCEVCEYIVEKKFSGVYLFPFEKIRQGTDVVIYGNGNVGKSYLKQIKMTKYCNIVAVVDKRGGEGVLEPRECKNLRYDYIVVAIANENVMQEIRVLLCELDVDKDKIICELGRDIFL